jgi:1-acyl-sn-glycerol-3-phosphate acyltransferase
MKETEAEPANLPREIRRVIAAGVWEGLLRGLHLEFTEESRRNLFEANELLKNNSMVVYINHTSMMEDVELPVSMVMAFLTNTRRIVGPIAMKHYDPARDWKNAVLLRFLKPLGVEIFPIVQPENVDANAEVYGDEEKRQMSIRLRAVMADAVKSPGTVIGLTPEGTRSKKGTLLPARGGIGYLESYDTDQTLRYLPVVIVLKKYSDRPKIQAGKPLSLGEMGLEKNMLPADPKERARFLADLHMERLAGMLPPSMRGAYPGK